MTKTKTVQVTRRCGHVEYVDILDDGRDKTRIARKERKVCTGCASVGVKQQAGVIPNGRGL